MGHRREREPEEEVAMPIELTNALTPHMQRVADCRECVKKCELDIETRKLALKEAKAAWETAVEKLNESIDEMVESERQPTLFGRYTGGGGDGDDLGDVTVEVEVKAGGGKVEEEAASEPLASLPAVPDVGVADEQGEPKQGGKKPKNR